MHYFILKQSPNRKKLEYKEAIFLVLESCLDQCSLISSYMEVLSHDYVLYNALFNFLDVSLFTRLISQSCIPDKPKGCSIFSYGHWIILQTQISQIFLGQFKALPLMYLFVMMKFMDYWENKDCFSKNIACQRNLIRLLTFINCECSSMLKTLERYQKCNYGAPDTSVSTREALVLPLFQLTSILIQNS